MHIWVKPFDIPQLPVIIRKFWRGNKKYYGSVLDTNGDELIKHQFGIYYNKGAKLVFGYYKNGLEHGRFTSFNIKKNTIQIYDFIEGKSSKIRKVKL